MKHEIWLFAVKAFIVILFISIAIAVLDYFYIVDLDFSAYTGMGR